MVAARFASDGLTKPIKHLKPKPGQKYEVGDLIELTGHLEAMVAYVHNPSKEVRQQEEEVPQLESLRTPVAKQTEKSFRQFLRKITRDTKIQSVILPLEELIERTRRYYKGLKSFSTDGEIRGFETLSVRVYYLIWMFWHEFEGHFTAPYIHTWLKREVDESPSDKLVEAIVTKLRRVARKLRNPKVKQRVIGK